MPNSGAGTIVFNEDKTQVLLCKREDFRIWVHPGGGVDDGESFEDAAIRETFEETGYHIAIDRLIGRYWHPQMPHGSHLLQIFEAHVIGGKPRKSFETIGLGFFPVNTLPPGTFRWTHAHIKDALSANGHVIERTETMPFLMALFTRIGIVLRDLRNKYVFNLE